jgi:hypothetical protein
MECFLRQKNAICISHALNADKGSDTFRIAGNGAPGKTDA